MFLIDATLYCLNSKKSDVLETADFLMKSGIGAFLASPEIVKFSKEINGRILIPYTAKNGKAYLKELPAEKIKSAEENHLLGLAYIKTNLEDLECFATDKNTYFTNYPNTFHEILSSNGRFCLDCSKSGIFSGALANEWIAAGGEYVLCAFLGLGGYPPTEEILAALYVKGRLPQNVNLRFINPIACRIADLSHIKIPSHKAVLGSHLFYVESGVHVNGIKKNTSCFEPFSPEEIGAQRKILIGTHASPAMLEQILEHFDISTAQSELNELMRRIRNLIRSGKKNLTETDIIKLYLEMTGEQTG